MKRLLFIAIISVLSLSTLNAQGVKVRYQGDAQVGYSFGVGDLAYDRVNVHYINSVRVGKYFSAGFGTGLDFYTNLTGENVSLALPLYANFRGYLPVSTRTSLFLSLDLGGSVGLSEGLERMSGLLVTPSLGAAFNVGQKNNAITVSLGYNHQEWRNNQVKGFSVNTDAVSLKVGFSF